MVNDVESSYAIWLAVMAGLFGLIFGSAINALVWRLYAQRSWVRGRSECSDCGHRLAVKDLVPVLSWVFLGGRCRYCKAKIQDHPLVELVTGLLFALSAYALAPTSWGGWLQLGFWFGLLILLVVLAVYDLRWLILPDKIMMPLIGLALIYSVVMAVLTQSTDVLLGALLAAVGAGGAFFALVYFSKGRAMGGGDIKLAFALGLMLGVKATLVALLVAFNVAAVVGVVMIIMKRRKSKDQIPFGPFLVGGAVIAFLYAQPVVDWYLNLNGLT